MGYLTSAADVTSRAGARTGRIGPMLDAGSSTAHARAAPPAQVVDDLLGLVTA